jgi:MoxR-like ATPase
MSSKSVTWPREVVEKVRRLKSVERSLKELFVSRDLAIDLLTLATLCREHLLLIGPPGTAKTDLLNRYTALVDAKSFHYLLTRFTEPSELFGPLDLEAFQKGDFKIHTAGMLPEAEIAFLDEVFQGSSAILNSLLALVNERIFHNGSRRDLVPLITLVGASNILPEDPGLRAFADRFLLRLHVEPIEEDKLEQLMDIGYELERERIEQVSMGARAGASLVATLKRGDLLELHKRVAEVDTSAVKPNYVALLRDLRAEGVELSDRRVVRGLKLVAAAALLRESTVAQPEDFWPLRHMWTRAEEAEAMSTVIKPHLNEGAVVGRSGARHIGDILSDLAILRNQRPAVSSEATLPGRLMALNRLRREVLRDHRDEEAARQQIEEAIRQGLVEMETV